MMRKILPDRTLALLGLFIIFLSRTPSRADDELSVLIFPGYGTSEIIRVAGRAFECQADERHAIGRLPFTRFKKALLSALPFLRDAEAGEPLVVRAGAVRTRVVSDRKGYFEAALPAPANAPWKGAVPVKAVYHGKEIAHGVVHVPDPDAELGVISDIDDTIKTTGVSEKRKVVKDVLLGDAASDRAVSGMARLYRRIAEGDSPPVRPVFYLSASPEALFPRIAEFLALRHFPPGSITLLRADIQLLAKDMLFKYKTTALGEILRTYPSMAFLLIGDSSQKDAEVYSAAALRHPAQVKEIYIRRTGEGTLKEGDFPACIFFYSAEEVEKDLVRKGIIREAWPSG